jgi:uncharacterized protein (DUF2249 family)
VHALMHIKAAGVPTAYGASMSLTSREQLVDVRPMPPRARHPAIFGAWSDLKSGDAIMLVNDHDPLPLYYQFGCEHQGQFRWEYVESGPEKWRVRITKGTFADPGFVPVRKTPPRPKSAPATFVEPSVVDTRPIFGRGETPCAAIDDAVETLIPGQPLVLLVPFEPAPLYQKMAAQGFTHKASKEEDGTWRIEFRK